MDKILSKLGLRKGNQKGRTDSKTPIGDDCREKPSRVDVLEFRRGDDEESLPSVCSEDSDIGVSTKPLMPSDGKERRATGTFKQIEIDRTTFVEPSRGTDDAAINDDARTAQHESNVETKPTISHGFEDSTAPLPCSEEPPLQNKHPLAVPEKAHEAHGVVDSPSHGIVRGPPPGLDRKVRGVQRLPKSSEKLVTHHQMKFTLPPILENSSLQPLPATVDYLLAEGNVQLPHVDVDLDKPDDVVLPTTLDGSYVGGADSHVGGDAPMRKATCPIPASTQADTVPTDDTLDPTCDKLHDEVPSIGISREACNNATNLSVADDYDAEKESALNVLAPPNTPAIKTVPTALEQKPVTRDDEVKIVEVNPGLDDSDPHGTVEAAGCGPHVDVGDVANDPLAKVLHLEDKCIEGGTAAATGCKDGKVDANKVGNYPPAEGLHLDEENVDAGAAAALEVDPVRVGHDHGDGAGGHGEAAKKREESHADYFVCRGCDTRSDAQFILGVDGHSKFCKFCEHLNCVVTLSCYRCREPIKVQANRRCPVICDFCGQAECRYYYDECLPTQLRGLPIEKTLGRGGFGSVVRVQDFDGMSKAVKIVCAYRRQDRDDAFHEAKMQALFDHEHVVKYEHHFEFDEHFFIKMEDAGKSLQEIVTAQGPLSNRQLALLASQIISGFLYLSKRTGEHFIHSDVTPRNFLNAGTMEHPVWKVADFGLSAYAKHSYGTKGSPCYQAPEVLFRRAKYSSKADVYSIGRTMEFAALNDIKHINDQSPLELQERLLKCNVDASVAHFILVATKFNVPERASLEELAGHPLIASILGFDVHPRWLIECAAPSLAKQIMSAPKENEDNLSDQDWCCKQHEPKKDGAGHSENESALKKLILERLERYGTLVDREDLCDDYDYKTKTCGNNACRRHHNSNTNMSVEGELHHCKAHLVGRCRLRVCKLLHNRNARVTSGLYSPSHNRHDPSILN